MPKLKTHQATAKRVVITGKKKVLKRKAGQDHFNSRESGETVMGKRRDVSVHQTELPSVRKMLPYDRP